MKKILGLIVASTLLLSAGSIYAKVDSGANLSNWYQNSFLKESGKLGAETATGIWTTLTKVNTFVLESKESIDSQIESFRDEQVKKAVAGIVEYRNNSKDQLDQTIIKLQEENFDDYAENAKIEEEAEVEQDIENILEEVLSSK